MFLNSLSKYSDLGLLVMRLGLGAMFMYHGLPKLLAGPEKWIKVGSAMKYINVDFAPVFWGFMASFAEVFGAICLIFGFFFVPACILLTFTMTIAAVMHIGRGDSLQTASHAIENGIVFFSLMLIGPGKHSIEK
ncbi:MAG: DoxX family protein [Nitrospiraceae bacterium]|nr:DoxX family protein [Nitrospiraceae bacterium]